MIRNRFSRTKPATMKMADTIEEQFVLRNSPVVTLRTYSMMRQPDQKVTLKPLPYPMDGLEPIIKADDLKLHYHGHHKAYIDDLNDLLPKADCALKAFDKEIIVPEYKEHDKMADLA